VAVVRATAAAAVIVGGWVKRGELQINVCSSVNCARSSFAVQSFFSGGNVGWWLRER
jgi:hypothetical protein